MAYQTNPAERIGTQGHEDVVRCSSCSEPADVATVDDKRRCKDCQPLDSLVGSTEERYAVGGAIGDHAYRVTAKGDGRGFTWSLYVDGQFLRGGYTRGTNIQRAYAAARELVGLSHAEALS